MLVERGWRGHGVGSALLRAAIGLAREQGLHKLSLEVFAHNTAAIALYRKHGFAREGRRARHYRRATESCGTQSSWAWRCRRYPAHHAQAAATRLRRSAFDLSHGTARGVTSVTGT